jgi:hypothetical protein
MPHLKPLTSILIILTFSLTARAVTTIAYDDAADPAYTPGAPYHNLNGGFGLDPWLHSLPAFPAGSGGPLHAYVASSTGNDPLGPPLTTIDTSGRSWGNNADPTGNTFQARRNLSASNPLPVGGTFSISYDNGDVDGQETISWGLANNTICQFFFNPSTSSNYQFKDVLTNATISTPIPQDWGGLRLTLTRDTASTYSFQATRLSDNLTFPLASNQPYDTTNITAIRTLTITNTDGGAGGGHAMYVNIIQATALPEPASLCIIAFTGGSACLRRKR